ncbi:J domain-containing protein [Calothrix rhizosoleniae]|uniref:J domain-containing protein n=1 Tax=Calothrix rhizosoleniae TaxID=888997 RepID=UPI000B4A1D99|nr:J domain-containing protein [Calothrix rhizosoleniae]
MDFGDCYRLLGLRAGASFIDIKASYRRLAQQYHPDINPNDQQAKDKFIALTEAYKLLLQVIPPPEVKAKSSQPPFAGEEIKFKQPEVAKPVKQKPPHLSEIEHQLKWKTYEQLQRFLQAKQFPQAISLAEALQQRLSNDAEVRQWLAISYQLWGRSLMAQKQMLKARIYLQKALKTDPLNRSLWNQVQRDLQRMETISASS